MSQTEHISGLSGDIENTASHEWSSIVDAHHHRVRANGHLDVRSKGQVLMGGRQLMGRVKLFTIGRLVASKTGAVPGALTRFGSYRLANCKFKKT